MALRVAQSEEEEMSDTPRTDVAGKIAAAKSIVHELCQRQRSWTMSIPARPDYDPDLVIMDALEAAERELSDLRAKLAAAEKEPTERKDSALRVARAAVTLGTTDGGKAVVKLIDAAIEKERSRG